MIIEFMGLPGVGKSYLGKQLENELSYRGIKCISVVERSRTSLRWKLLSKCLHIIIPTTAYYRELREELIEIASASANNSSRAVYNDNSVDIVDYIEQIVFLNYVYTKLQSSRTVYIFDEGIAQQFANIIVNFGSSIETVQYMLLLLGENPKTVYLTYPFEKIKQSITARNRHVCYIDELRDKELDQFLSSYQKACDSIACVVKPFIIDRTDDNRLYIDKVMQVILG